MPKTELEPYHDEKEHQRNSKKTAAAFAVGFVLLITFILIIALNTTTGYTPDNDREYKRLDDSRMETGRLNRFSNP